MFDDPYLGLPEPQRRLQLPEANPDQIHFARNSIASALNQYGRLGGGYVARFTSRSELGADYGDFSVVAAAPGGPFRILSHTQGALFAGEDRLGQEFSSLLIAAVATLVHMHPDHRDLVDCIIRADDMELILAWAYPVVANVE